MSFARHFDGSFGQLAHSASAIDWSGGFVGQTWKAIYAGFWYQLDVVDTNSRYMLAIGNPFGTAGSIARGRVSGAAFMFAFTDALKEASISYTLTPDVWNHWLGVWDLSVPGNLITKFYHNGTPGSISYAGTGTAAATLVATTNLILASLDGSSGDFPGSLTDVTCGMGPDTTGFPNDADVAALYAGSKRPNQIATGLPTWGNAGTGLKLYWPFNGTGTSEPEANGGPAITLVGGPTQSSGPTQLDGSGSTLFRRNLGRRAGSRGHRAFIY